MKNILRIIGFVSACAVALNCAGPAVSQTHIGRALDEHIALELVRGMSEGCGRALFDFVRVLPDGSIEKGADGLGYRIAEGMALVITELDWQYSHPKNNEAAGKAQTLRLFIQNLKDRTKQARVFESNVVLSSQGEGGASETMTAGFVVSSSARICPEVVPGPDGPPSGLLHILLRGYLIKQQ